MIRGTVFSRAGSRRSLDLVAILIFLLTTCLNVKGEVPQNTAPSAGQMTNAAQTAAPKTPGWFSKMLGLVAKKIKAQSKPAAVEEDPPEVVELNRMIQNVRYLSDTVDHQDPFLFEKTRGQVTAFLDDPQRFRSAVRYLREHNDDRLLDSVFTIFRRVNEDENLSVPKPTHSTESMLRQQKLVRTLGYSQLSSILLAGDEASLARKLEEYKKKVRKAYDDQEGRNTKLRDQLLRRAEILEKTLHVIHSGAVALALGAFAIVGHRVHLDRSATEAAGELGGLVGAWGLGSIHGFKRGYWPYIRNPITKFILKGTYRRLIDSFVSLIRSDADPALAEIVIRLAKAKTTSEPSLLKDAAFDALLKYHRPEVSRALYDIGVDDLGNKDYRRAYRAFSEVAERNRNDQLGRSARLIATALEIGKKYDRARLRQVAYYRARNLLLWGVPSVAGGFALFALMPHVVSFYTALFGGMGIYGTRLALGQLSRTGFFGYFRFPEDEIRQTLSPLRELHRQALIDAAKEENEIDGLASKQLKELLDSLDRTDRERSLALHEQHLASRAAEAAQETKSPNLKGSSSVITEEPGCETCLKDLASPPARKNEIE